MMRAVISAERVYQLTGEDMQAAGVGPRFWNSSLRGESPDLPHVQFLQRWIAELPHHLERGHGLLLFGDFGSGKTSLGVVLMKEVMARGGSALKVSAMDLSRHAIEKTRFDEQTSWQDRMDAVDLLVLDDLGAEHESGWSRSLVERLIRTRVESNRSMVITTNISGKDAPSIFGSAVHSVLAEAVFPVEVRGKWRNKVSEDMQAAMRLYLTDSGRASSG